MCGAKPERRGVPGRIGTAPGPLPRDDDRMAFKKTDPLPEPLHVGPQGPTGRTRLILVSWHFPPGRATGALRWQKLSRFAAERGWDLDVVTAHPDDLDATEPQRLAELPPGIRIWGVRRREALAERVEGTLWPLYDAARKLLRRPARARSNPDPEPSMIPSIGVTPRTEVSWRPSPRVVVASANSWIYFAKQRPWVQDAAALATAIADPEVHRAIVSCGPPHFAHEAARKASLATGLPFVMDMRDPWSLTPSVRESYASPLYFRTAKRKEAAVVDRASLVVTNTEPLRIGMQGAYPGAASRVITVTNGHDDEEPPEVTKERGRFVIGYAGAIYLDRDPRPLFDAAARVVRRRGLPPERFGVEFMGHADRFGGIPVSELARAVGLNGHLRVHPPGSRSEALAFMARSSLLVSLPQHQELAIPSKIFEYMCFDAWVLALARAGSAVDLLLRGSGADVVDPDDVEGIERVIDRRYEEFLAGEPPPRLSRERRFGRREQARILFDALEVALSRPR